MTTRDFARAAKEYAKETLFGLSLAAGMTPPATPDEEEKKEQPKKPGPSTTEILFGSCSTSKGDDEEGYEDDERCRHVNVLGNCDLCVAEESPEA